MPIIAIGAAALAAVVAAPAVGAVIGGGLAALTTMGALEITAAVGATLGAVGAVTRDKGLQTAGLVLGGIGAVGSLAGAAGLIDTSGSLFASSAAGAGAEAAGAAADDTNLVDAVSGMSPADVSANLGSEGAVPGAVTGLPPGVDATTGAVAPAADAGAAAASAQENSIINAADASAFAGSEGSTAITAPVSAAENAANQSAQLSGQTWTPGAQGFPIGPVTSGADQSVLQKIGNFATSSPLVTYGLIQAGGSLVGGMFSPITPAQVSQMNANAANLRAQAALTQQQQQNIASGVPRVVRSAPVTGAPQPVVGGGLINSLPANNPSAGAIQGVPT